MTLWIQPAAVTSHWRHSPLDSVGVLLSEAVSLVHEAAFDLGLNSFLSSERGVNDR